MSNTQDREPEIAVVGGSLVGPAAEVFFRAAGFTDVTTYEASTIAHPQSGGAMGIRMETADLLERVNVPLDGAIAFDSQEVTSYDLVNGKAVPRSRKHDPFPGLTVTWDGLHAALTRDLNVQHGFAVNDVREGHDGRPQLGFTNGNVKSADLVIFADGRKSIGRTLLDPTRALTYNGYVMWRGLTDPPLPEPTGFHRYYDNPNGVLFSLTEGLRPGGQSYWEFSHNLPEGTFTAMTGHSPTQRTFLLPKEVTPQARAIMEAFAFAHLPTVFADMVKRTTNVMGIPVNDLATATQAVFPIGKGNAVLVSDALATPRVQAGSGLNLGIQQVALLAAKFTKKHNVRSVLKAWEMFTIDQLLPFIELGRVRARRSNLGTYKPIRPGYTVSDTHGAWAHPQLIAIEGAAA